MYQSRQYEYIPQSIQMKWTTPLSLLFAKTQHTQTRTNQISPMRPVYG